MQKEIFFASKGFRLKCWTNHYAPALHEKTSRPSSYQIPARSSRVFPPGGGACRFRQPYRGRILGEPACAKIHAQLRTGDDQNLEAALDQLYDTDPAGYGEFIYAIEAAIECSILTREERSYDVLMFAVPVLTWSRFSIPSGPVTEAVLADLRVQLQTHVLAAECQFVLADCLFSPDQLPRGYHLTHELAGKLWAAAVAGEPEVAYESTPTGRNRPFLCPIPVIFLGQLRRRRESRCSAGSKPTGQPRAESPAIYQRQGFQRKKLCLRGRLRAREALRPLFRGCAFELLIPDGFFSAWRMADRLARPYSMHATVDFLQSTLNISPGNRLRAVIAPFYDQWLEEYRISFTLKDRDEVLYGHRLGTGWR